MSRRKIVLALSLLLLAVIVLPALYAAVNPYFFIEASSGAGDSVAKRAIEQKNPDLCGKINAIIQGLDVSTPQVRNGCYSQVALALKDETICNKMTSTEKDLCFKDVALVKKDPSVCKNVQYVGFRGMCYGEFAYETADKKVCDGLGEGEAKERCYLGYVEKTGDIAVCNTSFRTDKLRDACFFFVMRVSKDPKICKRVLDEYSRKDCEREVQDILSRR